MLSRYGFRTPLRPSAFAALLFVGGVIGSAVVSRSTGTAPPPASSPLPGASASRHVLAPSSASGLGFTANALVSANKASLLRSQAEPSIASNPLNRNEMVVGYADAVDDNQPGVSRSTDGGKTWSAPSGGALLPRPPAVTWATGALPTTSAGAIPRSPG